MAQSVPSYWVSVWDFTGLCTSHKWTYDPQYSLTNNRNEGHDYTVLSTQQDNLFCINYLVLISVTIVSSFMIL
jgi:hypothetical protein